MSTVEQPKQKLSFSALYSRFGTWFLLIILFVASAFMSPNFLNVQNLLNILKQISVVGIISCGITMIIFCGMTDLSAGLVCTLSGCLGAGVLVATGSVPLAFLVAIVCGACCSYINGVLITAYNLQPFIATLAMKYVAKGIVQVYTNGSPIRGFDQIRWLGQGNIAGIPVPVCIMLFLMIVIFIVLKFTKFGVNIYAIGGNARAAEASGIHVNRIKRIVYLISGCIVGIAGMVLNARMMSAQPSVGEGYEFDAITAVIIGGGSMKGGIGTMIGTFVGLVIVGLINNILSLMNVSTNYQLIAKGVLIGVAVILDSKTKYSGDVK